MIHLVVHGHFYQPPRENPWTEDVPVEPSAAPFHDWNERITAEATGPTPAPASSTTAAGSMAIVNDYELLSFNIGPTLASWLEAHHPDVYDLVVRGRPPQPARAIAQAYNHMILPLANERDVRTQMRWGLADFEHRFGRRPPGIWLPETAVNDDVLAVLVEEGVGFTILAPSQADRPGRGGPGLPLGASRAAPALIALVFYDGPLSHDLAFGHRRRCRPRRSCERADGGGPRRAGRAWPPTARRSATTTGTPTGPWPTPSPSRRRGAGVRPGRSAPWLGTHPPTETIGVRESAWSCAHGVGRWKEDCGCSSGGQPGWNQAWRAPLRAALDLLRDHAADVFERSRRERCCATRGRRGTPTSTCVLDPSAARRLPRRARAAPARTTLALTLLEAQRHAMLMYTTCGWFFDDIAGLETVQVLRYAARCIDLLREVGEPRRLEEAFLDVLDGAVSNDPPRATGAPVWARHVEPARVDAGAGRGPHRPARAAGRPGRRSR